MVRGSDNNALQRCVECKHFQECDIGKFIRGDMEHEEIYGQHHTILITLSTKMDEMSRGLAVVDLKIEKSAQATADSIKGLRQELRTMITDEVTAIEKRTETNSKTIQDILVSIGKLEVKSGVWGVVGGILATAAILLISFLKGA